MTINWGLRDKLQRNLNQNRTTWIKKMHLKMSSAKCQQFCLSLNLLILQCQWISSYEYHYRILNSRKELSYVDLAELELIYSEYCAKSACGMPCMLLTSLGCVKTWWLFFCKIQWTPQNLMRYETFFVNLFCLLHHRWTLCSIMYQTVWLNLKAVLNLCQMSECC